MRDSMKRGKSMEKANSFLQMVHFMMAILIIMIFMGVVINFYFIKF